MIKFDLTLTYDYGLSYVNYNTVNRNTVTCISFPIANIRKILSLRFTHVYPDGPAPYFSIIAPARAGAQLQQWAEIKAVAAAAVIDLGGSITHHHAVGRDHRPWYEKQRPDGFAGAMLAARAEMDPTGMLNPGVLFKAP